MRAQTRRADAAATPSLRPAANSLSLGRTRRDEPPPRCRFRWQIPLPGSQLRAQLAEILDDAVVHHGDVLGRVRMRIGFVWLAVGGPAGVADPGMAVQRLAAQPLLEVLQLALGAPPLEMVALQRRNPGEIIAAIFQPLEGTDQLLRNRRARQNTDNATHLTNISHLNYALSSN